MAPVSGSSNAASDLVEAAGRGVARALVARDSGDRKGITGWCSGLQHAADCTANDRDVLRIADDVHRGAAGLVSPAGIRSYALMAMTTVTPDGPGAWLLAGMLDYVYTAERRQC